MAAQPLETPVLRVSQPSDLLAYVPHAVGYHPRDSVVILSLRGPRGRIGLLARADLADLTGPQRRELGRHLANQLRADGAQRIVIVVYAPGATPREARTREVRIAVDSVRKAARMPLTEDVLLVGGTWYACLRCEDDGCCPPEGWPLRDLEGSAVAAAFVMAGSAPVSSRAALGPGSEADPAARASFRRGHRAELLRVARGERSHEARLAHAMSMLEGDRPSTTAGLGRLAAALEDPLLRDAIVAAVLEPGTRTIEAAALTGVFDRAYDRDATPPDFERSLRATSVLGRAARLADGQVRAELLAALAWLHWWRGEGAAAAVTCNEALALDPTHRLARLVGRTLAGAVPPGWVRAGRGREQPRRVS